MLVGCHSESFALMHLFNPFVFNYTFGWKFEVFLTICIIKPISINSVLATLRLSLLLAISHFLRFSKSEFTAALRSVTETPEAVRFVSSANNRGFVFDKHWGKSLIYNKKK